MKQEKSKKKIAYYIIGVVFIILCAIGVSQAQSKMCVEAAENDETQSVELASTAYEFEDNTGYIFSTDKKVASYSNGMTSLGTLSAEGESLTQSTYNDVQAIGVNSGTMLTFSYKQNVDTNTYDDKEWMLSLDSATSINEYSVGSIESGAIIVLKSSDGQNWIDCGAKMVDINGGTFSFSPDGSDIGAGTYYKFLSVAEIYYTTSYTYRTWYTLWIGTKTEYTNHYTNLGQESIVYICSNSAQVSFSSEATSDYEITNDSLTEEEITFLQKGTTLVDGSVSFSSVTVDNLGNSCYTTSYSYNGSEYKVFTDKSKVFSAAGVYKVKVETPLGVEKVTQFYIVDAGNDLAFSQYFGDGLIDGTMRMYDVTKSVPVYMIGKEFKISPQSDYLPGIYGNVYYFKDDTAIQANNYSIEYSFEGQTDTFNAVFDKEGYYIFDLYSSDPEITSGEIVNYSFRIYIKDDKSYTPTVNYELLSSTSRNLLFKRKVYAVTLKTAGGGSFIYCFPYEDGYYDMAYEVAENIELLSVENYDSYYYYKSQTSNIKEKYESKEKLFAAIKTFAKQNICILYLESNTEYLTQAADEYTLKDLTAQSIAKDTCVTIDESVKKALQANEIYLNDFKFAQVADYESDSITAVGEDGKSYDISYDVSLSSIFSTTQRVTITEKNWHGCNTYEAIYYATDDNLAEIKLNISGKEVTLNAESKKELEGSHVSVISAVDEYDSQSMAIITADNGKRIVVLLSELSGYYFENVNRTYEICVVNRFGTEIVFSLNTVEADKTISDTSMTGVSKNDEHAYVLSGSGKITEISQGFSDNTSETTESGNNSTIGTSSDTGRDNVNVIMIIGVSVGGIIVVALIVIIIFIVVRKRKI